MGVGQVLWVAAKSRCLPFSFCPPAPLLLKTLLGVSAMNPVPAPVWAHEPPRLRGPDGRPLSWTSICLTLRQMIGIA